MAGIASGVAVILEAARLVHDAFVAGLAVAFLDAEGVGAIGSAYHAIGGSAGSSSL